MTMDVEEIRKAQLRKITAEAKVAECQARRQTVMAERLEREEKERLSTWRYQHVYHFTDQVCASSVRLCLERLTEWAKTSPGCDITILFTSPGGGVTWGMALFDYIQQLRRKGHKVTTKALGMAASMAGILLQAGDVRVMGRESWLLIHEVSGGSEAGKVGELEDTVEWMKHMCERVINVFMERCGGKISREEFERKWGRKDWWIDSETALAYGFIDAVE